MDRAKITSGLSRGPVFLALALVLGMAAVLGAMPARAQELGQVISPVFTLNQERLFTETQYGARILAERQAAIETHVAETSKIETALEAEERTLTAKRQTLAPEEFRALATEFDERVRQLRLDREQTETNLLRQYQTAQDGFFQNVGPVIATLVRARGGVVLIDSRNVLMMVGDVDITTQAIEEVNRTLGEGPKVQYFVPLEKTDPDTPAAPTPIDETDGEGLIQPSGQTEPQPLETSPEMPTE